MFESVYESKILNQFYVELFSTDFRDYDSPTQNAKTDYIFEFDCFDKWFDYLIDSFVENNEDINKEDVLKELVTCPQFIEDMKQEYEDLQELCRDIYEDDEE